MRIGFRKTGKRKTKNDKYVIVDNSVEIGDISGSKSENTLKKQGKTGKICPSIELETTVKPTRSIQKRKQKMHALTAGCATKMSETARDGEEFSFFFTLQVTRRIEGEEGQSVQGRWSATGKGGYVIIAGKV